MNRIPLVLGSLVVLTGTAIAHEQDEPLTGRVTMEVRGEHRYVTSNGIPDHAPGRFPNRGNPNSIRAQSYEYRMPLHPIGLDAASPIRGPFGVALNGVPFDPGTAEYWSDQGRTHDRSSGWNYDALSGRIDLGLDEHHAHVQPTGAYHYHGLPTGLGSETWGAGDEGMRLIGYAADGFPIYGLLGHETPDDPSSPLITLTSSYRLKQGSRPDGDDSPGGVYDGTFVQDWEYVPGSGDLDECNGRFGVTPENPDGTYYYIVTEQFPFIPRCFRGTPDASFLRHRGPPQDGGRRPERGRPPPHRPPGRGPR